MNRIFYALLLLAGIYGIASCSNGDYSANPASPQAGSINPLNPLTKNQFTWGGTNPVSADINGVHWVADAASFALDTSGANVIIATKGVNIMMFYLRNVWSGNLYDMGYKVSSRYASYIDSASSLSGYYFSYLGNSGEVYMVENDSAIIKGMFYFQGVTTDGKLINVSNGYFNIAK